MDSHAPPILLFAYRIVSWTVIFFWGGGGGRKIFIKYNVTHALHAMQQNKKELVILYIQNNKEISVRKCLKIW